MGKADAWRTSCAKDATAYSMICICSQKKSNSEIRLHVSRYLQEFQPLGTVGGLYHFRDQIMLGDPSALIILYADISSDFPLKEMWEFHKQHNHGKHTVLGTEVSHLVYLAFLL